MILSSFFFSHFLLLFPSGPSKLFAGMLISEMTSPSQQDIASAVLEDVEASDVEDGMSKSDDVCRVLHYRYRQVACRFPLFLSSLLFLVSSSFSSILLAHPPSFLPSFLPSDSCSDDGC
jgi:hypothetical protein